MIDLSLLEKGDEVTLQDGTVWEVAHPRSQPDGFPYSLQYYLILTRIEGRQKYYQIGFWPKDGTDFEPRRSIIKIERLGGY